MFPARAGMSRLARCERGHKSDVPRASGDEPPVTSFGLSSKICSPRERG